MFWKERRNVVAVLAFFGFFNAYALRAILSVAIVAMTTIRTRLPVNSTVDESPEFNWDSKMSGHILSSFYYGYITTQLLGGTLSDKIGGQKLFGIGIVMTGILTLLTPSLSRRSVYLLIVLRVAEGVFEGVTFPCMSAVWSEWAPPLERTKLATLAASGCCVGTFVAMPASAYLAATFGWPSIFYVFGSIAIAWFVIWMKFVSETPAEDPRISISELEHIQRSLGNTPNQKITHPYKKILMSLPVWSIIISNFTDNWANYTIMTQLPMYLKDTFNYELGIVGFFSGLPYIAMTVALVFSGQIADWLQKRKIFTTTQVRKILMCGSSVAESIFLILACHSRSITATIVFITLGVTFGVCAYSGYGINNLDIAPQHAGIITGLSNTAGTLAGISSSVFAGYIVVFSWKIVFYVTSGMLLFGSVAYGIFGSGEIQVWNVDKRTVQTSSLLLKSKTSEPDNYD